jgi:hypothetical protein
MDELLQLLLVELRDPHLAEVGIVQKLKVVHANAPHLKSNSLRRARGDYLNNRLFDVEKAMHCQPPAKPLPSSCNSHLHQGLHGTLWTSTTDRQGLAQNLIFFKNLS